jgi:hypothetical protein
MAEQKGNGQSAFGAATAEARALGGEASQIASELAELLALEAGLARAEIAATSLRARRGLIIGAAAGFFGALAAVFLFLSLMFGLDTRLPLWAAALITTLIEALIALTLALLARRLLRGVSLVPRRFVGSLKEDWQWAKGLMTSKPP